MSTCVYGATVVKVHFSKAVPLRQAERYIQSKAANFKKMAQRLKIIG